MKLEIVSHCWHYAPQLTYQLGSLVLFPPQVSQVTMTVWFCIEDHATQAVIDYFARHEVPRVTWSFRSLSKERLFRRAIGRNISALETSADWIWFADVDMCFRRNCLDALTEQASAMSADLIFPRTIQISSSHELGDRNLAKVAGHPSLTDIDPADFVPHRYNRAIGGVQIVRGDTARRTGYCRDSRRYQRPLTRWSIMTNDDVAFRQSVGSKGQPIELPGVFRIRHRRYGAHDESGNLQQEVESEQR